MVGTQLESPRKSFFYSKSHRKPARSGSSFSRETGVSKRIHGGFRPRRPTMACEDFAVNEMTTSPSSVVVTLVFGADQRLFAAHESVLCTSPLFNVLRNTCSDSSIKRVSLSNEEPEVFSAVLEYLYRGDYCPLLVYNDTRDSWELESASDEGSRAESTVYHRGVDGNLLKDTVIYCAAQRYGLEELKQLALRKQGLQSGIQCSTILASARYAYANTPDDDYKLRAHYLALIIRSRGTFKRSGTMQLEM